MANNLETSNIIVDYDGGKQLAQAVSVQIGTMIWDEGIKTGWCIVEDEEGNKQLALKVFNLGTTGGGSAADVSFDNSETVHLTADTVQGVLEQVDALIESAEVTDLSSTSITLTNAAANTVYKYGTLTSLTITANDTSNLETIIYFTAGATCTVSFPNTLQWVNEDILSPDANTKYVISIVNNIAAYGSYN